MVFTIQAETPPLRGDATGALRVGDSNVLLELVYISELKRRIPLRNCFWGRSSDRMRA